MFKLSNQIKMAKHFTIQVDNMGAIFITKSHTTLARSKHFNICYGFVVEFINNGTINVKFVTRAENQIDGFTKIYQESLRETQHKLSAICAKNLVWEFSNQGCEATKDVKCERSTSRCHRRGVRGCVNGTSKQTDLNHMTGCTFGNNQIEVGHVKLYN